MSQTRTPRARSRAGRFALATALTLGGAALPVVLTATPALALNNGLAVTPPMGWNDWNAYGCNVSESLVKTTADTIVSSGMAADGYKCWASTRTPAP